MVPYLPNKRGASNKRGAWKIYQNLIKGDSLLKGEGGFFLFKNKQGAETALLIKGEVGNISLKYQHWLEVKKHVQY